MHLKRGYYVRFHVKVLFGHEFSRRGYTPSQRPMICDPEFTTNPLGSRRKYLFSKKSNQTNKRKPSSRQREIGIPLGIEFANRFMSDIRSGFRNFIDRL